MYIAGTRDIHDVWDDVSKVPFGDVVHAKRYGVAAYIFKLAPTVKAVVGHSLGGSVALELQRQYPHLKTRTYGAPVVSTTPGERYRHYGDPISMLDRGAQASSSSGLNPHVYTGYTKI